MTRSPVAWPANRAPNWVERPELSAPEPAIAAGPRPRLVAVLTVFALLGFATWRAVPPGPSSWLLPVLLLLEVSALLSVARSTARRTAAAPRPASSRPPLT